MPINETISKICNFLAYAAFGSCLFMWGRISGLEKGYLYGVFQAHPSLNGFGWYIDSYQHFNNWYFYITIGFGIYLVSKLFKPSFVSSVICVLSLAIVFQQHLDMWGYLSYRLFYAARTNDNVWMQNAPYFHLVLFVVVVFLIAAEFFLMNARKTNDVLTA